MVRHNPQRPCGIDSGLPSWPDLTEGMLVRRYKRFMADVALPDGRVVTAHCPNTGSMKGCSESGRPVYLSYSDKPSRRLPYTWELIDMPASLVCVNTFLTNKVVGRSIQEGLVPSLTGYEGIRSEVNNGRGSRIDLVLDHHALPPCFVEVKSCTWVEETKAFFPDAVTTRGLKHLKELQEEVRIGNRAVMFFLVQRMDAEAFSPADHIDPLYGKELRQAVSRGVEILSYDVRLTRERMTLNRVLPVDLL